MKSQEFVKKKLQGVSEVQVDLSPKSHENSNVQNWIKQIYDKYPQNPLNPRQRAIVWGEGNDQEFAIFELNPNPAKKNAVEITWFQAYPLRKGVGTKTMKELQAQAKVADITLTLYPWNKGQVSQSKLIKFYKQSGFTPTARGAKTMQWNSENPVNESVGQILAGFAVVGGLFFGSAGYTVYQDQLLMQEWLIIYQQIKYKHPTEAKKIKELIEKYDSSGFVHTSSKRMTKTEIESIIDKTKSYYNQTTDPKK